MITKRTQLLENINKELKKLNLDELSNILSLVKNKNNKIINYNDNITEVKRKSIEKYQNGMNVNTKKEIKNYRKEIEKNEK